MLTFEILYQDTNLVVIDKPAGFHVHRPEVRGEKVPREKIILHQLRDQIGQHVYPLHRLDVSTSGVLAFALSSESARHYGLHFQNQQIQKKYWAVVRGYLDPEGEIVLPLESETGDQLLEACTTYRSLHQLELPAAIGTRHPVARYSWLEVSPRTGRFHQIRRHFNRIAHPLIGDATHGDSRHNRFFREKLQISGLCLRAIELTLPQPDSTKLKISCGMNEKWKKLGVLFKLDPLPVDAKNDMRKA